MYNERQTGPVLFLDPTDLYCMDVLQNIFFCVLQKKESHNQFGAVLLIQTKSIKNVLVKYKY